MPSVFTPAPPEIDKRDVGHGGRPPTVRRPTGGGGEGDNWDKQPPGRRGPREMLSRYRVGLFFALAGDLMFFVAIISAFFARQASGHWDARNDWVSDWRPLIIPSILWLNTAVLVLSSLTVEIARRRLFHEPDVIEEWLGLGRPAAKRAMPWMIASIVLGSAFLAGQIVAWKQLAAEGAYFTSNPASHFFYLITGAHALHLAVGLIMLIAATIGLRTIQRLPVRQTLADCTAWYWHAMGVLWIFLFILLEFCE
jgi:cytochrome c oxidase subunit III